MKERKTPTNRMLLITEAKKQLKDITAASLHIPRAHYLVFAETVTNPMPMLMPDCNVTPRVPHINFGHHPLNKKEAKRILDDEQELYWMTI